MGRNLSNILEKKKKKGINQERIWDLGNRRLNIKRTKGTTASCPVTLESNYPRWEHRTEGLRKRVIIWPATETETQYHPPPLAEL